MEFSFDLTSDRQHVHDAVKSIVLTIFFYRAFGSIVPATAEFLDIPYPYFESEELDNEIEQKIDQLLSRIDSNIATPILTSTSSTTTPLGSPGARNFTLSSTMSSNNTNNNNPYANIKFNDPESLDEQVEDNWGSSSLHSLNNAYNKHQTKSPNSMPTTSSTLQSSSSNKATGASNAKFGQLTLRFYEKKKLKKPTWFGKTEEEITWETWTINVRVLQKHRDLSLLTNNLKLQFEKTITEISETCDHNKDHIPIITSTDIFPFPYSVSTSHGDNDNWKAFIKKMLKDPVY